MYVKVFKTQISTEALHLNIIRTLYEHYRTEQEH